MAGGKETPRQRMIGMMYLVLTALLALQVSNQILQKFVLINEGLERTSRNYVTKNEFVVTNIKSTVEEQGNNPRDVPKVAAAQEVRAATKEVTEYLEDLKQQLITQSNARNEEGVFVNSALKNTEIAGNMFVNNGKGDELKEKLNSFPVQISQILSKIGLTGIEFKPIALDAKDIEIYANDSEVKNKSFTNLNFVKSPVGAVIALLSQFQNEVLNIEGEALTEITKSIGSFYFKADILKGQIAAVSNVVAAGTKFQGDMFIASASSSAAPTMTLEGRGAVPVVDGFGKVEFTVPPASSYDDKGLSRQVLKGQIVTNVGGEDQVIPVEYEYFVAQPIIKVSSEVVQQLYADCANDLLIEVPALGNTYSPEFNITNGQSIKGNRPGQVTVIPGASGKVNIGVSSGGNRIGSVDFDIKPVPAPTIRVVGSNGAELDLSQAQPVNVLSGIKVVAKPEPNFARTMSKDSNFDVTGGELILLRNDVPRATVPIGSGMRSLLESARPGDDIVVRVTQVTRTNFRGNKINSEQREIIRIPIK